SLLTLSNASSSNGDLGMMVDRLLSQPTGLFYAGLEPGIQSIWLWHGLLELCHPSGAGWELLGLSFAHRGRGVQRSRSRPGRCRLSGNPRANESWADSRW